VTIPKRVSQIIFLIVGLVVLYWVIAPYGIDNYIKVFTGISPVLFLLALILPSLEELSASFQLHTIFNSTGVDIKFKDMFWINQWSSFLGDIQKGVGVLVAIDSISLKSDTSHIDTASRYSLYYVTNIVIRAFATSIGFVYLLNLVPENYKTFFIGIIIFFVVASFGLTFTVFGNSWIKGIVRSTFGKIPLVGKIANSMADIEIKETKNTMAKLFVFGLFNWIFASLHWFVIAYAIGYPLSFWFCLLTISVISLAKFVPFIPASLGVYDFVVMIGLGSVNVPALVGLSFAMIERITDTLSNSIAIIKPEYLRFFNKPKEAVK
jgi:uncharacterized membrane protein YbhN (UPF0104 family)